MRVHRGIRDEGDGSEVEINPLYVRAARYPVPRRLPEHSMLPTTALQVVRDELVLDGNARLNLAGPQTMVPPNPLPLVKNLALRRYGDLWGGSAKTAPAEPGVGRHHP